MTSPALLVDFSIDNSVRLALVLRGQRPPASKVYQSHSLTDLDGIFNDFLTEAGNPDLMGAAFSVCGWERDGAFEMPNFSYRIDRTWARERLNINRLHFVNDCVAAALAITVLKPSEIRSIGKGHAEAGQVKAMITLGRGLATTCVVDDDLGNAMALPCAGGHSDLAVTNDREYALYQRFAAKYGHVSRARAVCTPGMVEIYGWLHALDGTQADTLTGAQIAARARQGDAVAREALDLVTGWLAALASDIALINGARGGVYMSGSFFDLVGDAFDRDLFTARFVNKGRLKGQLEEVGVFQVHTQEIEMIGLSTLFD